MTATAWIVTGLTIAGFLLTTGGLVFRGAWMLRDAIGKLAGATDTMRLSIEHLHQTVAKLEGSVGKLHEKLHDHETRLVMVERERQRRTREKAMEGLNHDH